MSTKITAFQPNYGNAVINSRDRQISKLFYEFIAVANDGSTPIIVKVYKTGATWRAIAWVHLKARKLPVSGHKLKEVYSIGKAHHSSNHPDSGMMKAIKDALTSCGFEFETDIKDWSNDLEHAQELLTELGNYLLIETCGNFENTAYILTVVAAHG